LKEFDVVKNYEEEIASTNRMIDLYKEGLKQERQRKKYFMKRIQTYKKKIEAVSL
jgi:hypothetical protein